MSDYFQFRTNVKQA